MTAPLSHFAINTVDVAATQSFYASVFGWTFQDYGPPGFVQIVAEPGGPPIGAIQLRRDLLGGEPTRGFECTFAVDDVDEVRRRVEASGQRILMERFTITGVGHLIAFEDPGGNPVLAMQYDGAAV